MEHTAAEAIIGFLSLASVRHGVTEVPIYGFLEQINILHREFPKIVPEISSRDMYLKFLYGDMVMSKTDLSVGLDPEQRRIELSSIAANRNLASLAERQGPLFIKRLEPIARMFAQLIRATPTPPRAA